VTRLVAVIVEEPPKSQAIANPSGQKVPDRGAAKAGAMSFGRMDDGSAKRLTDAP
jgi:hypothetical protein